MKVRAVSFVAALLVACGGKPEAQTFPNHPNADLVVYVTFGAKKPASFDPSSPDPRVRKAYRQLTELAGHPIAFHFDEAIVPKWTGDFDTLFAECIEQVTRELAGLQRAWPEGFKRARAIEKIEVVYDATAKHPWDARLEKDGRILVITLTPDHWRLVPEGAIRHAVRGADEQGKVERFAEREPERVKGEEYGAYLDWLEHDAEVYEAKRPKPGAALSHEDRRAGILVRIARLAELASGARADAAAIQGIRRYMTTEGFDVLKSAYHKRAHDRGTPPSPAFVKAEAAWMRWFLATEPSFSDDERWEVIPKMPIPASHDDARRYVDSAWPGFDLAGYGLSVFDAWARAGHPGPKAEGDSGEGKRQWLHDWFVCPLHVRKDGQPGSPPRACDLHAFYTYMLDRPDGEKRLVAHLLARKDPLLTAEVAKNLAHSPRVFAIAQALDPDDAQWTAAVNVLAGAFLGFEHKDWFPEVVRLWPHAGKRGGLLYVLARLDLYEDERSFKWADVPRALGGPIGAAEYAAFLDQGPLALARAGLPMRALAPGFSRVDAVVPRVERAAAQDAPRALRSLHHGLCAEKNAADLARLRAYLARRTHAHPSEEAEYRGIAGGC